MKIELPKPEDINIKVYQQVLSGKLNRFPRHFWKEEAKSAPAIIRYLIEEVLRWDEYDIKTKFNTAILEEYKLAGLLRYGYQRRIFDILEDAYPGRFLPWELQMVPNGYWREVAHCIEATRWLINEKLNWTKDDIMKYYNKNIFYNNHMTGLLKWGWNGETYKAIVLSFPEYNLQTWDLLTVPLTNFSREEAVTAIKWYIEEKMQWTEEEIRKNWRTRNLQGDGILRIVRIQFEKQMFEAIDAVYPNRFKRWEFPLPNGYWTFERAKEALTWLVLDKLQMNPEEARTQLTLEKVYDYNLRGMLENGFQSGLKEAIKKTFPQ